ncbi:MAG: helix-turn-helix transcriptional regulator [Pseudomonadota bacterium]
MLRELMDGKESFVINVPMMSPMSDKVPTAGVSIRSHLSKRVLAPHFEDLWKHGLMLAHLFNHKCISDAQMFKDGVEPLTCRERECLQFVAVGLRPIEIAHRLVITKPTVDFHLKGARQKLKAISIAQAVANAIYYNQISL